MSEVEITTKFTSELGRAARPFARRNEAAGRFVAMHKRHGAVVLEVLRNELAAASAELAAGTLDESCLLRLVAGQRHTTSTWRQYVDRVHAVLAAGLPSACHSQKPATEPLLQEICDGLLKAAGETLSREFPFMEWGSTRTKPDWSDERIGLWVELKYIRGRKDVGPISGAIAEDITRYGDIGRRTLFVVYDPDHHAVNESALVEAVEKHAGMFARFIR